MKSKTYYNPIRDAMLGLVVGDALGVPVEFKGRKEMKKYTVKVMLGFGTHHQPPGPWSDDSALALCLAEALIGGYNLGRVGLLLFLMSQRGLSKKIRRVIRCGSALRCIANDVGLRNCFSSLPKIQTLTGQIIRYIIYIKK